jgi:hypothetical protein
MSQVAEFFPSKCKVLSSNPILPSKKVKEGRKGEGGKGRNETEGKRREESAAS